MIKLLPQDESNRLVVVFLGEFWENEVVISEYKMALTMEVIFCVFIFLRTIALKFKIWCIG